ncbi:MAG TPA: hypothetical protein DEH78_26010 [Solibacterales bacterium]|nr:hypothetical protein [Bryobacterales bacterium]
MVDGGLARGSTPSTIPRAGAPPFQARQVYRAPYRLGISLSAEDIEENQREMWRNFPREEGG